MISAIFLAVALISAAAGVILVASGLRDSRKCSAPAVARVVEIRKSSVINDESYAPVIEFSAGGRRVRAKAQTEKGTARRRVPYKEGDYIKVRYNPGNPEIFIVPGYDVNIKTVLGAGSLAAAAVLSAAGVIFHLA